MLKMLGDSPSSMFGEKVHSSGENGFGVCMGAASRGAASRGAASRGVSRGAASRGAASRGVSRAPKCL